MHGCCHYFQTKTKRLKQWENFKFNTFFCLIFAFFISLYIWHQNWWSSQTYLGGPTETGVEGVKPAKHSSTKNLANFGHICFIETFVIYIYVMHNDKCNNLYLTATALHNSLMAILLLLTLRIKFSQIGPGKSLFFC